MIRKMIPLLLVLMMLCGCSKKSSRLFTYTDIPFQPYEVQNTGVINADLDTVFESALSRAVMIGIQREKALPDRENKKITLKLRFRDPEDFIDCGRYIQTGLGEESIFTHLSTELVYADPDTTHLFADMIIKFSELAESSTKVEIACSYRIQALSETTLPEVYYEYENRIRNENKIINGKLVNVPVPYTEKITKYKKVPFSQFVFIDAKTTYTDGDKCQSNQTLEKKVLALIEEEVTARQSGQK